jgi:hypothetical protein
MWMSGDVKGLAGQEIDLLTILIGNDPMPRENYPCMRGVT